MSPILTWNESRFNHCYVTNLDMRENMSWIFNKKNRVIVRSTCVSKTLRLLSELLNNWRLSDVEIQGWNWARLLEQRVPKMTQIFAWGSSMKIIKVIIMTIIVSWLAFKNLLAWICYILLGGYACRVWGILWFLCKA